MLRSYIVEFHRLGTLVQLIAKNSQFFAATGTPLERAVRESTSDSLLSAVPAASQAQPERKSILIDANALLLADIPGGSTALESAYHVAYGFDARNSSFTATNNTEDLTGFAVSAHYSIPKLPAPPSMSSPSHSSPPAHLEDERSLFLGYYYSFAKLQEPMTPRMADDRIGHFMVRRWDFSSDSASSFPEVYTSSAGDSRKKTPTPRCPSQRFRSFYWLDRDIPVKYARRSRPAFSSGTRRSKRSASKTPYAWKCSRTTRHSAPRTRGTRRSDGSCAHSPSPAIGPRPRRSAHRRDPRRGRRDRGWSWWPASPPGIRARLAPRAHASGDEGFCDYGDVAMDELAFTLRSARGPRRNRS